MKKKILFALMLAAILSVVLCGCDNQNIDEPKDDVIDMTKFPFYTEVDAAAYDFDGDNIVQPYWLGNVIHNETVMLIDNGEGAVGNLMYTPKKILSVRDYKYETEYVEGVDYTVDGKKIIRTAASSMPFLTNENIELGENIPSPYRRVDSIANTETDFVWMGAIYSEGSLIYGHQVMVSYVYDVKDMYKDVFAEYEDDLAPNVKAKLVNGEDVKIVIVGDSVGAGCSSSGYFSREPHMDTFIELFVEELNKKYDGTVTLENLAVGGQTSNWGIVQGNIVSVVNENPDLVFIHFGINDAGAGHGKSIYRDNIEAFVLSVQAQVPQCEIVGIKAFMVNPMLYNDERFADYWEKLDEIAEMNDNFYTFDMFSMSMKMLETKNYMEMTGNGINHLNDFTARLYAMNLCAAFIDYLE